jgi:monoamine oxidase
VDWTLDNVWDNPATSERRSSLMTFIVGGAADYWSTKTKDERAEAVIEHLRRIFKFDDDALLHPSNVNGNYVELNWPGAADEQRLPSPAAMLGPGVFMGCYQALRQPLGFVHYAGSESAHEWNGYMDGAVESGFRAGNEILAALDRPL